MKSYKFAALLLFCVLLFIPSLVRPVFGFMRIDIKKPDVKEPNVDEIISGLISLSYIVIFILILLMLGGVIRRPSAGIPWFLIFFILLMAILFVVPLFIPYPQYLDPPESFKKMEIKGPVADIFIALGLPESWMHIPAIIYLFVLPFAAIYTLVWAFLQSLGIFENVPSSVNRVLAFIVAFLTIPMTTFVKIVWILFSFMGVFSVVIFVATFVMGIFFRGAGVARKEYTLLLKTYESIEREISSKLAELKKRVGELSSESIEREVGRLAERYGGLYPRLKELHAQVLAADSVEKKRELVRGFSFEGGKGEAKS